MKPKPKPPAPTLKSRAKPRPVVPFTVKGKGRPRGSKGNARLTRRDKIDQSPSFSNRSASNVRKTGYLLDSITPSVNFDDYTEGQIFKVQMFVGEYVKDFNATAAARRMGFNYNQATGAALAIMEEPLFHRLLWEHMQTMKTEAVINRNSILLALLRESGYHGEDASHGARISALRAMAKILGLEVIKTETTISTGGGVIQVPVVGGLDDWEAAAVDAQARLKEEVRT